MYSHESRNLRPVEKKHGIFGAQRPEVIHLVKAFKYLLTAVVSLLLTSLTGHLSMCSGKGTKLGAGISRQNVYSSSHASDLKQAMNFSGSYFPPLKYSFKYVLLKILLRL